MQNITIRRPNLSDIDELHNHFRIVITDTFCKEGLGDDIQGIEGEIEEKKRMLREDFDSNGKGQFFLLACYQEGIVGTIAYGPCSQLIEDCSKGEIKDIVEIGTLFVLPEYQGSGIGKLLLNSLFIVLISKSIEEFCLDSGYTRAQKIWIKKFGEPSFIIKNYWGEGFDHYIWHCKLKDTPISYKI